MTEDKKNEVVKFVRKSVAELKKGDESTYFKWLGYAPVGQPQDEKDERFAIVVGFIVTEEEDDYEIGMKVAYSKNGSTEDYEEDWESPESETEGIGEEYVGLEDASPAKIARGVDDLLSSWESYVEEKDAEFLEYEEGLMSDTAGLRESRRRKL